MINIVSYLNFDGIRYGAAPNDILLHFGEPLRKGLSRTKKVELFYPEYTIRFDAENNLMSECTLLPGCNATFNGRVVRWNESFLRDIAALDTELVDLCGVIVSLKFGITFGGFHDGDISQLALTVFRRGELDFLKEHMVPFAFKR